MSLTGKIQNYEIVEELGHGAMGEVYKAVDTRMFGRTVALKILEPDLASDEQVIGRFIREVRLARKVSHPNVARTYDIGRHRGRSYLTMELVEGQTLASLLSDRGRLPVARSAEIARELCAGLQAAHDVGVLHRDLKPANVLVDEAGRPYVTDFGLARTQQLDEDSRRLTRTGALVIHADDRVKTGRFAVRLDGNPRRRMNADTVRVGLALDGERPPADGAIHAHRVPGAGNSGEVELIQTNPRRCRRSRHQHKHKANRQEQAATHRQNLRDT